MVESRARGYSQITVIFALISILVSSLIVGGLARLAVPGPDPMPIWMTILIGFLGSVIGVVVGQLLFGRTGGFLFSLIGAILLVIGYRRFIQHRPVTGPDARRWPQ